MRLFSFGGGVQSVAAMVLAAQDYDYMPYSNFVFAHVGADSENPGTLAYLEQVVKPFMEKHKLYLHEVNWIGIKGPRKGQYRTLWDDLLNGSQKDIPIPVRLSSGAFANRKCTGRYKIEPIARLTRSWGATILQPAHMGLGISWDESQRQAQSQTAWHVNEYPLISDPDTGELRKITRDRCIEIIRDAGLPIPPKSSCFFCPFHSLKDFQELPPELLAKATYLEDVLNERRDRLGLDPIKLAPVPLRYIHNEFNDSEEFQGCESGHCLT